jgi:hypothetical protein
MVRKLHFIVHSKKHSICTSKTQPCAPPCERYNHTWLWRCVYSCTQQRFCLCCRFQDCCTSESQFCFQQQHRLLFELLTSDIKRFVVLYSIYMCDEKLMLISKNTEYYIVLLNPHPYTIPSSSSIPWPECEISNAYTHLSYK